MYLFHRQASFLLQACFLLLCVWLLPVIIKAQSPPEEAFPEITFINSTFLGNESRNYYGEDPPDALHVLWKHYLGKGITVISRAIGEKEWKGAGWTGQPLMVREDGELFLIQGSFDHHLKKIRASDGKLIWQYAFDDVIKGTGTLWRHPYPSGPEEQVLILQGSRLGIHHFLDAKHIPSYRAVSLHSGREFWRLDVKYTGSYSRDVDASALVYRDTVYIGLENSLFTVLDPRPSSVRIRDGMQQPRILEEHPLHTHEDIRAHGANIVTEGSACRIGNHLYIPSGSGRIWGYNLETRTMDWQYYVGSDIDGSAVATSDSCLLISVEKQYIKGKGGILKLDPRKRGDEAVVWFFPTENSDFVSWEGGVIGTAAVTDYYHKDLSWAAFTAIDGHVYVVDHRKIAEYKVPGPDSLTLFPQPRLIFKSKVGASIATPLFVENKLIVAGYGGIRLYEFNREGDFTLLDEFGGIFEATPFVFRKKIYIASRDGYLYCLGKKNM